MTPLFKEGKHVPVKKLINLCPSKKPSKKIIPILQGERDSHTPVAEICPGAN